MEDLKAEVERLQRELLQRNEELSERDTKVAAMEAEIERLEAAAMSGDEEIDDSVRNEREKGPEKELPALRTSRVTIQRGAPLLQ